MNWKYALSLILVAIIALPMVSGITALASTPVLNSVPGDTAAVVLKGTLVEDRYSLWQYSYKMYRWAGESPVEALEEAKEYLFEVNGWHDLRLGLTEYGEFVVVNDTVRAGLALGADEAEMNDSESLASWAVSPAEMFSGWVFYIKYIRNVGPTWSNDTREVLAWAVSGNWINAGEGRGVLGKWAFNKSGSSILWSDDYAVQEGTLIPNGVKVLYESARLAIVRTNVSIVDNIDLDGDDDPDKADTVADVIFTVVFNKVKKYAIVYKDIKIKLNPQAVQTIVAFGFSNREKLDIAAAINDKLDSYVHYYHNFAKSFYQYPILHWNKTDILVAYNDGDPKQGVPEDMQYVVFKFFWPNVTEYTVYNPDEMSPQPTQETLPFGGDEDDPKDGILPVGTAVPDIPYPPGEPSVPFVIVQWFFSRFHNRADFNALLDSLRDGSYVRDPRNSDVFVPISQQVRFVEVIGMTTRSDYCKPIKPPIDINWDEPTQENLALLKATSDHDDSVTGCYDVEKGWADSPGLEVLYFWHEVFTPLDLNDVDEHTFKIITLGFNAPPEDTAGAAALTGPHFFPISIPMIMLDVYATKPYPITWGSPRKSIPYVLYGVEDSNATHKWFIAIDEVEGFKRVMGLLNFTFGVYDDVKEKPKQPIAGGFSTEWEVDVNETHKWVCRYFYPSINQLYERLAWCDLIGKVQGTKYEQKVFRYPNTNYTATGIISVAGPKANQVTRYYNDFYFAILREGNYTEAGEPITYALITPTGVTGVAPTSDKEKPSIDIFPISTWNVGQDLFYKDDYFVVAVARDVNGTIGYSVWGWNARDSFWGAVWASYYLGHFGGWLPKGVVALIVKVDYTDDYREPVKFHIIHALGTVTEFKLAYERAFGKGLPIPPLPPSPPTPGLGVINAVNEGTYDWKSVGLTAYLGTYISDGSTWIYKKIEGWPWWGEKLETNDDTEVWFDPAAIEKIEVLRVGLS